ncbi:TPA: ead/Ea22-like family protein [Salmonella enterica subsp. enterica serovar Anatum]|uniref:ead/Ea22-like family protein n=1 Tax=Citrobacter cronae TaxID=1748967 RepID=UPI0018FFA42C|nr:ead/Ea22-like family protein [Citrobacter cronae]MBJ8384046.1 ead/Ea22-like family protein [Citrobacter cronae]HCM4048296.1 ead/Ea22-like family protein [Salmonella enterica subsp. enterica serovar Anatum]
MTALNKQAIDFSQPLETESGESVKHICHDVIEYKCARVCVDIVTGIVYSSPYVGLKIRNKEANPRAKLREQIESAADAYWQFDNGWISDMKCGDLSHEYLLFAKEPKNVLALLDELEAAESYAKDRDEENQDLMLTIGRLRVEREASEAELNDALCELLPGTQYMDPPDGGSVTPLEQVRRMVADYLERISNLESRKVCVPRISNDEFWLNFNNRIVFREETYRSAVIKAIEDAGIGVKGE